jgi:hypothetical protein
VSLWLLESHGRVLGSNTLDNPAASAWIAVQEIRVWEVNTPTRLLFATRPEMQLKKRRACEEVVLDMDVVPYLMGFTFGWKGESYASKSRTYAQSSQLCNLFFQQFSHHFTNVLSHVKRVTYLRNSMNGFLLSQLRALAS